MTESREAKTEKPIQDESAVAQPAVIWHCGFCGDLPPTEIIEPYGQGWCHVVYVPVDEDEWEPQPCGPVTKAT